MDLATLTRAYERCRTTLEAHELGGMLESLQQVSAVHELRLRYKPANVRLLVIAESHVRRSDEQFARCGPAFLYNHVYYTPWWRHLLSPAYGFHQKTNPAYRKQCLERLRGAGFWVLDACVVALSGFRKVNSAWPNRPFDALRRELFTICWRELVSAALHQCLLSGPAEMVVLQSVATLLPELLFVTGGQQATIKFPQRANISVYGSEDYRFGTATFRDAVTRSMAAK